SHSSLTDHRILRTPSETLAVLETDSGGSPLDLIRHTSSSGSREAQLDLRNRALAYAQVAPRYRELSRTGLAILEQAVAEFPNDVEIQSAYGLILTVARPEEQA